MLRPYRHSFMNSAGNQRSNHMRRNSFPPPNRVNAFIGFSFEMNLFRADAQRFCQRLPHLREMRAKLRLFGNHHRIDMLDRKMLLIQQLSCMFQKDHAVRALPLWIGVRKMRPDIAKPRRPQQRIAKSMCQHVAVRVPHRSFVKRQLNPANNKFPPLRQAMQVITDSRPACRSPRSLDSPSAALDPPCKEKTEADEKN